MSTRNQTPTILTNATEGAHFRSKHKARKRVGIPTCDPESESTRRVRVVLWRMAEAMPVGRSFRNVPAIATVSKVGDMARA